MEKREKIIVAISIIAAVYGALDFLVLSKKDDSSEVIQQNSSEIITAAKTKLSSQAIDGQVQNLIKKINSPWPEDIFFRRPHDNIAEEGSSNADKEAIIQQFTPTLFNYSGFLEMADEKIAIINGTDYKLDDNIKGFTLTQISKDKIQVTLQGEPFDVDIKPEQEAGTITTQRK